MSPAGDTPNAPTGPETGRETSWEASQPAGQVWSIVVAAGSGSRFGGTVPKQFVEVAGRRVLDWSVAAATEVSDGVVVVLPPESAPDAMPVPAATDVPILHAVGGSSRSESVRSGLALVPASAAIVLVHDAARPVASTALFQRVVDAVRSGADGAVPVVPIVDTVQDVDGNPVDRSVLRSVQTPQGFAADALRNAHRGGCDATDDATLVRQAGGTIATVTGERWNLKITDPTDEHIVAVLLESRR